MVQFKRAFLGQETLPFKRAVTSQKCLRVSGKHNDLEEVGVTRRHHTFFEMLGNFSFGDYFKRDAIRFAWQLMTEDYGLPRERLWATVHHTDDEAAKLWEEIAGLPPSRIFRLGDKDNFWQMGETGPCGPCSEIHYDLRAEPARGRDVTVQEFEALGERGDFLELWNLVFMQYDRSADGRLTPLPAPSIDTGAGLERVTSVLQGVQSNYETDLFVPLIERAAQAIGRPYDPASPSAVSYRVLADHARAVAFLLADGVFPSNEGRGYVLRRVLRRAVRHAWLQGRREPTLVDVVDEVVNRMGGAYPDLVQRRDDVLRVTREEEEKFLTTIDAGTERIYSLTAEPGRVGAKGSDARSIESDKPRISGEEAFRLHDTFGFPIDLTELIARERGFEVDTEAFERALEEQRERSRQDRRAAGVELSAETLSEGWTEFASEPQEWVGYETTDVDTEVVAVRRENGRVALQLRRNPFYAEAGGQVSDHGVIEGDGWKVRVDDVRRLGTRVVALGELDGQLPAAGPFRARAAVTPEERRDTQRNHTATHLLHAALRAVLGAHVLQRGSLVAPDRLRFDFAHPRPMTRDEIRRVEDMVNREILRDLAVATEQTTYPEAVARGAMALFGEKYGDVVRMVVVPGVSLELCGGTHVRHTSDIGMFRVVSESGVASGIRRIEAVTGSGAYRRTLAREELLDEAAAAARTTPEALVRRIEQMADENRELRRQLEKARSAGSADLVGELIAGATAVNGARVIAHALDVESADELRAVGDRLRERLGTGVAVLAGRQPDRVSLLVVVTDDMLAKGVRANDVIREVAKLTGGSGGGRPHMAQGGAGDPARVPAALDRTADIVRALLAGA
jgi:alanyl-tRNA synthetase